MKKNITPILLLAGAGAVAYFFLKKSSSSSESQKLLSEGEGEGEQPQPAGKDSDLTKTDEPIDNKEIDATIDTTKTGGSVAAAIRQAKAVSEGIKDIAILIKTETGNILYRKGKKRKKRRSRVRTKKTRFGKGKFRTKRRFI